MATDPKARLERLRQHAVRGFSRARADGAVARRAQGWLIAHPSAMADVDAMWLEALRGEGPLAAWLMAGADVQAWRIDVPLHSVLACHPFPDLPQWAEVPK